MLVSKVGVHRLRGVALMAVITSVCSAGFCLFGYDQGVMSGVVVSQYWLKTMGNPSTIMVSTITAVYDIGAVVGAIAAAFTSEPLGRKRTLIFGTIVLLVGTILMGTCAERIQMMIARVVTGIGIGYITSVTPVYQSEITLPEHRGWLTPRWLIRHDPTPTRGVTVLAKLRDLPEEHPIVQREAQDIINAIELESKEEGSWGDLFRSNGIMAHKRFYLALGIQFMQQMTGICIVTYYTPTLFQVSLHMSQQMSLFLGCWVQTWYFIASLVTTDGVVRRLRIEKRAQAEVAAREQGSIKGVAERSETTSLEKEKASEERVESAVRH
ncbi:hypothetical protein POSPLADRAFT_1046006 [Postia placenta MAD-698-R-SB12]|uniref:Major facilitator superfamily (MFS) profile domain-containing protein n=1 Tax=Postia placenta MAD-698-R-SB12 TaxID=670580 RepID=A0A1X6N1N5_9APHY|nr:hypothetical protein POSPLADRAFT_1046006 [Postia placenta MAD-698-R-SB12]OSX62528.1 hypothetical protein POSPLADRAFT_1046006 [Postia placenta MAD-698-R-SB12]